MPTSSRRPTLFHRIECVVTELWISLVMEVCCFLWQSEKRRVYLKINKSTGWENVMAVELVGRIPMYSNVHLNATHQVLTTENSFTSIKMRFSFGPKSKP